MECSWLEDKGVFAQHYMQKMSLHSTGLHRSVLHSLSQKVEVRLFWGYLNFWDIWVWGFSLSVGHTHQKGGRKTNLYIIQNILLHVWWSYIINDIYSEVIDKNIFHNILILWPLCLYIVKVWTLTLSHHPPHPPLSLGFALTLALFQRQSLFIFFLYIIGSYINRLLHAKDNKMKLQIK